MNKKTLTKVTYFVLAALTIIAFFVSSRVTVSETTPLWQALGAWTLIPPLVAIVLAFLTKNVIISLAAGVFSGTMMVSLVGGTNVFKSITGAFTLMIKSMVNSMADPWNAGILLQVMAIGGLIALVSKMGGTFAIAEKLSQKAKTARSSQFITWILGLFVFFDDYANSLIVGPIMRPVTDKQRISREKLAFIVDATAAPIAGIAIVSTWIGYELSLIQEELTALSITKSAYAIFLETIPFRFYNIFILAFIVFSIVLLKEFGPMYKAEKRARTTGKVIADGSTPLAIGENMDIKPIAGMKTNIWNAIIPIFVLMAASLLGFYFNGYNALDEASLELVNSSPFSLTAIRICYSSSDASVVLFMAAMLAGIVAIVMGVFQKLFTIKDGVDTWIEGWKSMIITVVILLLAWSIADVIKNQLDADMYLADALKNTIPAFIIPTIIFLLGSIISFATGTSYGTMGILMPLAIPLANSASGGDMNLITLSIGAVLTGAIFGDHCSPISDTTILSSMGSSCDHIDHVKTQLLYAVVVAIISIVFGFLPAALGVSSLITLPAGILATGATLFIFGKSVGNKVSSS
ncbi:MAG: sodium:proton antiporter [Firmicutes bacterium HGW-Firmicutes-1]|nr:MAG: sodium:proton antiporter [Firmicutes bacterium HGW-Firmicutes-1]